MQEAATSSKNGRSQPEEAGFRAAAGLAALGSLSGMSPFGERSGREMEAMAAGMMHEANGREMLAVVAGIGRPFINSALRATPRQIRSANVVQRLVAAAGEVAARVGAEDVTLQSIADEAGIGIKTVYRYFSSPADILRMLVRTRQLRQLKDIEAHLAGTAFTSVYDLVRDLAEAIVRTYLPEPGEAARLHFVFIRDYHDIPYAEFRDVAVAVIRAIHRTGLSVGEDFQTRVCYALPAVAAAAKMAALTDPLALCETAFYNAMSEILLRAIGCAS